MDLEYNELKEQHTALLAAVVTLVGAKDRKDVCGKDGGYEILKNAGWRKAKLALELCDGKKPDASANTLPIQNVTNSDKTIDLTEKEALHVNALILKSEKKNAFITGYLLRVLEKIEHKFPHIKA